MKITVGIEPTICAPKTARLPTAIIVIITSVAKVNIIFQNQSLWTRKFSSVSSKHIKRS